MLKCLELLFTILLLFGFLSSLGWKMFLGYENIFLFNSSKKSSQLLPWKRWTRAEQEIQVKGFKPVYILAYNIIIQSIVFFNFICKGPQEVFCYFCACPLEPFHIHWHYHDRRKFLLKKDSPAKYKTFLELYFRIAVLEVGVCFLPMALLFLLCDPAVKLFVWCQVAESEIQQNFCITAFCRTSRN